MNDNDSKGVVKVVAVVGRSQVEAGVIVGRGLCATWWWHHQTVVV